MPRPASVVLRLASLLFTIGLAGCAVETGGSARYAAPARAAAPRASVRVASADILPPPSRTERRRMPEPELDPEGEAPFSSVVAVTSQTGRTIASCLGVMVAPRVAITAGHCVTERARIAVRAATEKSKSVEVESFWIDPDADPKNRKVDMDSTDVALLVLAKPLPMPAYARYAHGPLDGNARATGIRHGDGVLESMRFTLRPATTSARYYVSAGFAKPGDSGSPVFIGHGVDRIVVGVLAGGGPGREVFARVDLMARKLDELVASTSQDRTAPQAPAKGAPPKDAPSKPVPQKGAPPRPAPPPANVTWT